MNKSSSTDSENQVRPELGSVKKTKLVDLGPVNVETRGSAGGTPDYPSPGKDTPNTIGWIDLSQPK